MKPIGAIPAVEVWHCDDVRLAVFFEFAVPRFPPAHPPLLRQLDVLVIDCLPMALDEASAALRDMQPMLMADPKPILMIVSMFMIT